MAHLGKLPLTHMRAALVLGVDDAADELLHLVPLALGAEGELALDHDVQHDAQAPHIRCVPLVLGLREHLRQARHLNQHWRAYIHSEAACWLAFGSVITK